MKDWVKGDGQCKNARGTHFNDIKLNKREKYKLDQSLLRAHVSPWKPRKMNEPQDSW